MYVSHSAIPQQPSQRVSNLAKKRAKEVTELHSSPRKFNPEAGRRVVMILSTPLVLKLKTLAFEQHMSVQKYVSQMIEKQLEKL